MLHDIDFVAESGKTTAIIGSTGCRKSTLVNLIPRLYDVTGGSITLDGKDIRRITMKDLRDEIGFVPQKGVLFSGTIASSFPTSVLEKMMRQMKRLQKQRKLRRQLSSSKQKMTNTKRRSPRAEATSPAVRNSVWRLRVPFWQTTRFLSSREITKSCSRQMDSMQICITRSLRMLWHSRSVKIEK